MADTDHTAQQAEIAARLAQVKRKQQRLQELLELEEEEARLVALQEVCIRPSPSHTSPLTSCRV